MPLLGAFCLLLLPGFASATKNALYGYDVEMNSNPETPRLLLADEKANIVVDVLGGNAFTWCINAFLAAKVGKKVHTLFSYGSRESNTVNEIVMKSYVGKNAGLYIRNIYKDAGPAPEPDKWSLVCVSWSGETGELHYYLNGEEKGKVVDFQKGTTIGKQGTISLGQGQGGFDSGYSAADGIYGRMTQFNAFTRVLTPDEVKRVYEGKLYGDAVDWRESTWVVAGNTRMLPTEAPNAATQKLPCGNGGNGGNGGNDGNDGKTTATDLSICLRFNGVTCPKDSVNLFYYINELGSKELSLAVNETRDTKIIVGIEERDLPHLIVGTEWQHWCFVWSEGRLGIYIDGGLFDTLEKFPDGTQMSTNGDLYFLESNSKKRFKAEGSDYKVWERALTPNEVTNEYRQYMAASKPDRTYIIMNGGMSSADPIVYSRLLY